MRSDLDVEPALRRRSRTPRRMYPLRWVLAGLVLAGVLLIGGPYFFFNVVEGKPPAKLQLPEVKGAAASGPLAGTWTVAGGSEAGYRVHEILLGQSHTAVGRTSKVTGGMDISGTEVTAADFVVDVGSIRSDQASRDYQFDHFIMEAYEYPDATFELTEPIQLGAVPAVGQTIRRTATGDLTMRGVKRVVRFTLSAERSSSAIDVNAEIPLRFDLWHIPNPSFAVAQVGDTGTVEVLLHLVRSAG